MIAMQYSFTLPADYDMSIIGRRITEKGHLIDGFPGLLMKAYLWSRKSAHDGENLYSPFYVWDSPAGMNDFVSGPGFVALTQSFGWPGVKVWSVWNSVLSKPIKSAKFATRTILPTAPYANLAELREAETSQAVIDVEKGGALASVSAFEPTTWTRVRFQLWQEPVAVPKGGIGYDVGYMSVTGMNEKR